MPDLEKQLGTNRLGHPLFFYDEVTSTNDLVKERARQGAAEGLVVSARRQTRGRGRQGKSWQSKRDCGVYASVLLRPPWSAKESGWLAVLGGVAMFDALGGLGVQGLTLKWPNDVLARGKKIAGVLIEPLLSEDAIEFAVMGIGVNVAQTADDWTGEVRETATSCRLEGLSVTHDDVLVALLRRLEAWYDRTLPRQFAPMLEAWKKGGGKAEIPEIIPI